MSDTLLVVEASQRIGKWLDSPFPPTLVLSYCSEFDVTPRQLLDHIEMLEKIEFFKKGKE